MRETTPVSEINIEEIRNNVKKNQDEIKSKYLEEKRNNIIQEIDDLSLADISNNTINSCNRPYLVDLAFIIDRLKNDLEVDKNFESMQVKLDITDQLSKMKELPSFKTECHIESNQCTKSTSIISFIRKFVFRQKKYRIIFHAKEAKFNEEYYKVNNIPFICILILMLAFLVFSIIHRVPLLIGASIISMIILILIWFVCL